MYKILSIDGGGMRGVIPATILTILEEHKEKSVSEMFDMLVGASTGAILAAGLCVPDNVGNHPKHQAADILKLYKKHGSEIFDRSLVHEIPIIGQLAGAFDEVYSDKPLKRVLKKYFANVLLSNSLKSLVITSYDIEKRNSYFFKSHFAWEDEDRDYLLRHVLRATTAAPTFFEPAVVPSKRKNSTRRVLIDGGVVSCNPAMCGYSEAIVNGDIKNNEILLVSLGTGIATHPISYSKAKGWGALGWAREIVGIFMDGSSDAVDYQMRQLLPDHKKGGNQRYFRFDGKLDVGYDAWDNADKTNLRTLQKKAKDILSAQQSEFELLKRLL